MKNNPTGCVRLLSLAEEEDSFNSGASEFTHISEAPAPWQGVRRRSRVRVAHFVFEITLLQAIMLTLLLVCSFSPRVHSIPRGPVFYCVGIPLPKQQKTRQYLSGFCGGGRGIRSCLLQSNLGQQFLCFAKAFGQLLKTTHRVVFLTLSFESLLHSA